MVSSGALRFAGAALHSRGFGALRVLAFLIRAPRFGGSHRTLPPPRACGLAARPTGFAPSAGARLIRERRALLASIARDRERGRRRKRLTAA